MANVGKDDVVYELGSGDGRIAIAAVRDFGARRAVGIEKDPQRIHESRENATKAGVTDRVEFIQGDLFTADFGHRDIQPPTGADLLWSPTNAKDQMLALISGAKHSIRVYDEELSDSTIVTALARAAKRGVSVQVCGENQYGHYDRQFTELTDAGAKVTYFSSSHGFYIHAKVIEVDEGTARAQMYVGSENFTTNSLRQNRELGLILTGKSVLRSVASTFAGDFRKATPFH